MKPREQPCYSPPMNKPEVVAKSSITPRLLRITDAAQYLSCTFTYIETLIREKRVPSIILGKRRLIDVLDLDRFVEEQKEEQA